MNGQVLNPHKGTYTHCGSVRFVELRLELLFDWEARND